METLEAFFNGLRTARHETNLFYGKKNCRVRRQLLASILSFKNDMVFFRHSNMEE